MHETKSHKVPSHRMHCDEYCLEMKSIRYLQDRKNRPMKYLKFPIIFYPSSCRLTLYLDEKIAFPESREIGDASLIDVVEVLEGRVPRRRRELHQRRRGFGTAENESEALSRSMEHDCSRLGGHPDDNKTVLITGIEVLSNANDRGFRRGRTHGFFSLGAVAKYLCWDSRRPRTRLRPSLTI